MSGSLSPADAIWRGEHPDTARLLTGDVIAAVRALKDEPGDELQIWGSGQLRAWKCLTGRAIRGDRRKIRTAVGAGDDLGRATAISM